MRIALDAMGGDIFPQPNIDGALLALREQPQLEILLVGDPAQLESVANTEFGDRLRIHPAEGWVEMTEKPTDALRKKPNCSITACWKLMASKQVDAVVSAGHTGAVVAAGLTTRLFLKGVKRPGIAVSLPTLKGRAVLMDVGANPAARPEHLFQYGVMGSLYARETLGIAEPRVGLMNIGTEDGKGNELVREAHQLMVNSHLKSRYVGNVEGRDLYQGACDVVVCEGFLGNVILKVSEGLVELLTRSVAHELNSQLQQEKGLAMQALKNLDKKYHYHEAGGAPLLGVDGICIICHGASNERSIQNALRVATEMKERGLNEQIVEQLALEASVAG